MDSTPRAAWEQMAIDLALLDLAQEEPVTILRLYRWTEDTVSLGANESATRTWDRPRLEQSGIPVVRRPTGGRAVWHAADDLTYAVGGPLASPAALRQAYRAIHARIAAAFATLGLPARLAAPPERFPGLGPGACFDLAVGGEVLIGARKAVGSAQLARGRAFLQHGAIARADRLPALHRFRIGAASESGAPVAPDLPDAALLAESLAEAWRRAGAVEIGAELTDRLEQMSIQHSPQFRDPAWTWRR